MMRSAKEFPSAKNFQKSEVIARWSPSLSQKLHSFGSFCGGILLFPSLAYALSLPFDISSYTNLNALLGEEIATAVIKTVGFALNHRPYEPATPLGTQLGLDMGLELTLVKLPSDLGPALNKASPSGGAVTLPPFIPVPKFHIHKGVSANWTYGFSAIAYQGFRVFGADIKTSLYHPTEGPTYAMRGSFTWAEFGFASTKTASTELLVSRKVGFGDPYLGVGFEYTYGKIKLSLKDLGISVPVDSNDTIEGKAKAMGYFAIGGVQLKPANLGFQLVLEGSYSSVGMSTLGTKFGFSF